jgi:hypothetical protein
MQKTGSGSSGISRGTGEENEKGRQQSERDTLKITREGLAEELRNSSGFREIVSFLNSSITHMTTQSVL